LAATAEAAERVRVFGAGRCGSPNTGAERDSSADQYFRDHFAMLGRHVIFFPRDETVVRLATETTTSGVRRLHLRIHTRPTRPFRVPRLRATWLAGYIDGSCFCWSTGRRSEALCRAIRRAWAEVVVTEQTGDGRRVRGGWVVWLLLAVPFAAILIAQGRNVLFAVWGPVVPVEVVECHGNLKRSSCTGVWRPTGEPEKTVTIHGGVAPRTTVNVRMYVLGALLASSW
jgi:hypothetical protein